MTTTTRPTPRNWTPTHDAAVRHTRDAVNAAVAGSPWQVKIALAALNDLLSGVCALRCATAVEAQVARRTRALRVVA